MIVATEAHWYEPVHWNTDGLLIPVADAWNAVGMDDWQTDLWPLC